MNSKLEKAENYLEWVFKIGILIYALLSFNSLCYGKIVISWVLWPVVLCGIVLLIIKLKDWKEYIRTPSTFLLGLFILSYMLSFIVNLEYGYKDGIIKLFFLVFYFFILFARKKEIKKKKIKREITVLGWILTLYMFVSVLVSFGFMIFKYTKVETIENGWDIGIGFLWGRLWGVFTEPNYAAVCASIVIILSFYFYKKSDRKAIKAFLILNNILQLLYIAFTDSRTGCVAFGFGIAFFSFNCMNYKRLRKNSRIKLYMVILVPTVILILGIITPKQITTVYNRCEEMFSQESGEDNSQYEVNRGYDLTEDISNRRFDIWKSGMEVFATTPLVGTSYTNILPYTLANCKGTYLIKNSAEKNFSSIHNEVLNILVGQGIIGFVIFCAFLVYSMSKYIKYYFESSEEDAFFNNIMLSCVAVATMGSMFLTGMFYSNSPAVIMFWICLGNFMGCFEKKIRDIPQNVVK